MFKGISVIFWPSDYLYRCGLDALAYLTFQRYMIILVGIYTLLTCVFVLPISLKGAEFKDPDASEKFIAYEQSTIANVEPTSDLMYAYPILNIFFFLLGLLALRSYANSTLVTEIETYDLKTLLVTDIPKSKRNKDAIADFFISKYPSLGIEEIQFGYNIYKLLGLNWDKLYFDIAIDWCKSRIKEGEDPIVNNMIGGYFLTILECGKKRKPVDGLEYYIAKKNEVMSQFYEERYKVLKSPLGVAFVTFRTQEMAYVALMGCAVTQRTGSDQFYIPDLTWTLAYAPFPSDIFWENIHTSKTKYWIIHVAVFLIFLVMVFFFSTPSVTIVVFRYLNIDTKGGRVLRGLDKVVYHYFPSLILVSMSSILPVLVLFSNIFVPFLTRSDYYDALMVKLYVYLTIMVLMMPFTESFSIYFLVERFLQTQRLFRSECLAIPRYSVLFSNYLIQFSLVTVAVELLRIPEISLYLLLLVFARSKAELLSVRYKIDTEFPVGMHYAYIIMNISITVTFLTMGPLVTPLGLLYLCMKHLIDRYNIFFAYSSPQSGKHIHAAAINLTLTTYLISSLIGFVYQLIRMSRIDTVGIIYIINILLTSAIVIAQYIIPDRHFLQLFAMSHSKRVQEYRSSIASISDSAKSGKSSESDFSWIRESRLWSVYEIQSDIYAERNYCPPVLEDDVLEDEEDSDEDDY